MLKLEDVVVRYGRASALRGLSLEVGEGETVALIGANGAGKSTTLKAISGLVKTAGGRILFRDEDLTKVTASRIVGKGIIHIPEGRRIFPELSVYENLEMGAGLRKDKDNVKKEIADLFDMFPVLKERTKQAGGTLSGGEQQMLAIARGLVAKPTLLMLDEPSLGLAPLVIKEVGETILRLKARGITILLVEQNAMMALKVSDRAYVLETGKIAREGSSQMMLQDDTIRSSYLGA